MTTESNRMSELEETRMEDVAMDLEESYVSETSAGSVSVDWSILTDVSIQSNDENVGEDRASPDIMFAYPTQTHIDYQSTPSRPLIPKSLWSHHTRPAMQKICTGVYLGSYACARAHNMSEGDLKREKITAILRVRAANESDNVGVPSNLPDPDIEQLTLEVGETSLDPIHKLFAQAIGFILGALKSGRRCLVLGRTGTNRSATLVMAYLIYRRGWSSTEAFLYVKGIRDIVQPTAGFMDRLKDFETQVPEIKWYEFKTSLRGPPVKRHIGDSEAMEHDNSDGDNPASAKRPLLMLDKSFNGFGGAGNSGGVADFPHA